MKPTVGCGKRTARNASSRERVYRICRIGPGGCDQCHTARPGVKTVASPAGASGRGSPAVGGKAGHSHMRTLFFRLDRPGEVGAAGGKQGGVSIVKTLL
jgi:mono/diheme cytochrome c family protein